MNLNFRSFNTVRWATKSLFIWEFISNFYQTFFCLLTYLMLVGSTNQERFKSVHSTLYL